MEKRIITGVVGEGRYTLPDMPFPPSTNRQLIQIQGGKQRTKAPEARKFDDAITEYFYLNQRSVALIRADLRQLASKRYLFKLDLDFYFTHSQVFTKDGQIKKIDMNNRIKSIVDACSKILEVDDSMFFSHLCQKLVTTSKEPYINAHISVLKPEELRQ